jgi:hypothetical protein
MTKKSSLEMVVFALVLALGLPTVIVVAAAVGS